MQRYKQSSFFNSVLCRSLLALSMWALPAVAQIRLRAAKAASDGLRLQYGTPLVVGFIYVGPKDDYGYNQAHAEGAAAVSKMDGVKILEEERVAETVDVQKSMKGMIEQDGAKVIFPTSFGYFDPHVLDRGQGIS